MLLNTYYNNINSCVSSLMCLDYNRKYYILLFVTNDITIV